MDREWIKLVLPLAIMMISLGLALYILPQNCHLIDNSVGHAFSLADQCKDDGQVNWARFVMILGVGLSTGTFIYLNKDLVPSKERTQLK